MQDFLNFFPNTLNGHCDNASKSANQYLFMPRTVSVQMQHLEYWERKCFIIVFS